VEFLKAEPEAAPYALRAMTTVARAAESGLAGPQRAVLDAVQQLVLETELDAETLPPIAPEELAPHLRDPAQARQLVRLMVAISLADGPPSKEQVALMSSFDAALRVDEPSVGVVRHLAKGRLLRFRLAFMRHSHVRTYLRNTYGMLGGILPMARALLVARGVVGENVELASRFRALEKLPEDTLGQQFFRHCTQEGLPFAGEKGGFPVGALFHDFAHVLGGYDTSPEGEMKNAAFQAGFTQDDDDFFTMLFAIVIHTAGINMTPFEMPVELGRIGQGDLAMDVLRGWRRGAAMKVDLGHDWDFWQYVELPIDVARRQLGVPPIAATRRQLGVPPIAATS
jgi:tellurite resistance protein